VLLQATVFNGLPIVHGFTTRNGGVSTGSFASLNVSKKRGDAAVAVEENLRRIAKAGGYDAMKLRRVVQVHGNTVLAASDLGPGSEADALWSDTTTAADVVSVTTADCVPLLISDDTGRYVAAVHSGWRGTVANIVGVTVARAAAEGVAAGRLRAAIGPCIERDAFEVGEEVARQFDEVFVERTGHAKPHVDLVAAVRAQLEAAGVPSDNVERVGGCTHADESLYFSYRRDGVGTGQALAFIGPPG